MSGNQHQGPSAGTLVISALAVLNAIVLEDGYTSDGIGYSWLCITVPLLFIAIFFGRRPRLVRRHETRDVIPGNKKLTEPALLPADILPAKEKSVN